MQIPYFSWSELRKVWFAPFYSNLMNDLFRLLKGRYWIDYSGYYATKFKEAEEISQTNSPIQLEPLSEQSHLKINEFKTYLRSKRYSDNTIETYADALITFLRFVAPKTLMELDNNDVIRFNNDYIIQNKLSASFQNQVINALKLFFNIIEKRK